MEKGIVKAQGMGPGRHVPITICLHVGSGRAPVAKTCIRDHKCGHCAYDQWLEDVEEIEWANESFKLAEGLLNKAA